MRRFLVAVLIVLPCFAQEHDLSIRVTAVEVPVTVVDRAGNPLAGLTRNDFEITDDGRKVTITGFETIDMSKVIVDNATPLAPAAYRNFLLLFDLANSSPGTIGRARSASRDFVRRQLGRRDLAAVATFSADHGLRILTSFTSDRDLLDHAIMTLGHPTYFREPDPLRVSLRDVASAARISAGNGLHQAGEVPIMDIAQWSKMTNKMRDQELRGRLRKQFSAMADVARTLDPLRGQKQVILLSEGFDPRLVQGRMAASRTFSDAHEANVTDVFDSDVQFGSSALLTDLEAMGQTFRRSGVTLHAIDIKGLRSSVDASDGVMQGDTSESLYLLTRPAGGTVLKNATDLAENFVQLLAQQEVVYLLAFEAKADQPGKYHPLKVKVPGARDAKVAHRSGYYESAATATALEKTLTLADIMMTEADVKDIPLTITAMTLPSKSGPARIPIVVEMPGESLLRNVPAGSVTANVFVYAFDEDYQVRDFLQQRIGLDLTKSGSALRGAGLRYVGLLTLPAGKYALKAIARVEETGRVGFLRTDIDIPAPNGPTVLPPLFASQRRGWINVAAPGSGAAAVDALTIAGEAFVPAPDVTLRSDDTVRVALFLHDTPTDGLDVSPLIVASDGSSQAAPLALVGRTPPDAEGSAKVLFELKPANLAAGDYKLQLTVKPKDGQPSVVDVPFRIE